MRWTKLAGVAAGVLVLTGCAYGYRRATVSLRYDVGARPDASYYCYDCHGYRFFDPYYDFCTRHGFQYRWSRHPQVIALYRERYVRIKERHPEYGRYRYRDGYRADPRYREPREYEEGRAEPGQKPGPRVKPGGKRKERERDRDDAGTKERYKGD